MRELVIKGGLLISPANGYRRTKKDILVKNGRIAAVEDDIHAEGEVVDASGCLVTPGFIDIHTHCYPKAFLGLEPDVLGLERGPPPFWMPAAAERTLMRIFGRITSGKVGQKYSRC